MAIDAYAQYGGSVLTPSLADADSSSAARSDAQSSAQTDPYAAYGGSAITQPPASDAPSGNAPTQSGAGDPYARYGGSVTQPTQPAQPSVWQRIGNWADKALEYGLGLDNNLTADALEQAETPGVMNRIAGGLEYVLSGVPFAGAPLVRAMRESDAGQYGRAAIDTASAALAIIPADRIASFFVKPASDYLPEAAQLLRKSGAVTLVHAESDAPVAHIAETTASADEIKEAIGQPTQASFDLAAHNGTAVTVPDSATVPVVSKDELVSDAITKQLAVEKTLAAHGIDPATIRSPEDVQTLLEDTRSLIAQNLDPRVVSRIGWAAQRQLASDLGIDVDTLLARRSGEAWSAEQSVAARSLLLASQEQVLNAARTAANGGSDDVNAFIQTLARHSLIADEVAGIKSEAGRALQSLQMPDAQLPQARVSNALTKLNAMSPEAKIKAAQLLSKLDMNDSRAVNQFVREITPSTTPQKLWELYRNGLLSSPHVLIVKGASELMLAALETTAMSLRGVASQARSIIFGKAPTAWASDSIYFARGAFDALRDMPKVLAGKLDLSMMPDFEKYSQKAIKGSLGDLVNLPGTVLNRETNLVWLMHYRGYLNMLAARMARAEGLEGDALAARMAYIASNPPDQMAKAASEFALHNTFQKELGRFGNSIQRVIDSANVAGVPIGRFIVPFFKTPANIVKVAVEYSPLGLAQGAIRGDADAISRGVLGSAIASAIAYGTLTGRISGGGALNWRTREAMQDTGWQPYSVRIGNDWVSLHKLEPLGMLIGVTADAATALAKQGATPTNQSAAHEAVRMIARNLSDLPFLQTLSNIGEALGSSDPASAVSRFARFEVGSVIPSIVRNAALIHDPTYRIAQTFPQAIERNVPGLTKNVPPVLDTAGQPVERPASALGGINPFPVTQQRNDAAMNELARLQLPAIAPIKSLMIGGQRVSVTPDEASALQRDDEAMLYNWLNENVSDPAYKSLSDAEKVKMISAVRREIAKTRAERLAALRSQQETIQ